MIYNIRKNNSGISLVEVVVSVSIFVLLMLSSTGIFQMVIQAQRSATAGQSVQESIRYALEVMSKEIRFAKKDADGSCGVLSPDRIYYSSDGTDLIFKNKNDECVKYYRQGDLLMIDRRKGSTNTAAVTPQNIKVDDLKFRLINPPTSYQPMVTLMLSVEAGDKSKFRQQLRIQTSITARNYQ